MSDMIRILVTGSRDWDDRVTIWNALNEAWDDYGQPIVVHGACPTGADKIADEWAAIHLVDVERWPADWDTHGKKAGPIRNLEMVELGADLCLAFCKNYSRGTTHCANAANAAGIPTKWYTEISDDPE